MKPLMIVLEGPECTGKTTIIQRLADEFSCPTHKRVRTKNRFAMLSGVINDIDQQLMRTSGVSGDSLIVFDRWQLVSDIVYEKYCYNNSSILEPLYPVLGKTCHEANILVIYMTIDKDEMVNRFNVRGDKLRTVEEAVQVHHAYALMFDGDEYKDHGRVPLGTYLPFEKVDVTGLDKDQVYEKIVSIIKKNGGNV